jgi:hypothetical protein
MSRFWALDYALTVINPTTEGNRPAATRASASDARSGQCRDSTQAATRLIANQSFVLRQAVAHMEVGGTP